MRVLVVTVVHHPLDARIHERQIRALRADGVAVTYAAPWTAAGVAPDAVCDGVAVIDLPRAVGRRRTAALRAARRVIARHGPQHDLVLLHDPELVLAVVGRTQRLPPIVLDVHEDLGASLGDRSWVPSVLRPLGARLARRLEVWAEAHLHLLLAERAYAARFRRPHHVVPNLPWLPDAPPPPGTYRRVIYVGRLSRGRGAEELVALGSLLARSGGPTLDVVGPADADVRQLIAGAAEEGWLTWHGFVPNEQATDLIRGSIAGLALLHDLPNYRTSLPTKVIEYLASGVPVIATPLEESRRVVEGSAAGLLVPFGDVPATADAVRALTEDAELRCRLGAAGRAYVASEASWDAMAPAFVLLLRSLAGESP
jgi:glycosyltransferase involved in cell wall biosynthesis